MNEHEDDTVAEEGALAPVSTPPLFLLEGDATPEQVAALTAVLSSLGTAEPAPEPVSEWARPSRRLRTSHAHGVGAWRSSALPRRDGQAS